MERRGNVFVQHDNKERLNIRRGCRKPGHLFVWADKFCIISPYVSKGNYCTLLFTYKNVYGFTFTKKRAQGNGDVINITNLIHTSLPLSPLFMFKVSTCFGHHLPIFRGYYTNVVLVSVVYGCRCGLFSPRIAHIYNRTQHSPKLRLCSASWRMAKRCPKRVEALNPNKSESEVCIKLVVFITLLWCTVNRTSK
jgi:hypothetical protein